GAAEGCFGVVTAEADPVVKAVVGIVKSNGSAISAASAGTDYVVPGGNVATATALAADPANCAAGQIALGITAAGVAECTAAPSGLTSVGATTFTGALTGNASTASALAANGANCNAGQAPLGVDASGAVEGCFSVVTSITGAYSAVDFTVKSLTAAKSSGVAGASMNYEANSTDTSVVGWMGPASISESWAYQFSSTQPTAGQVMVFAAPSGSGGPGGMKTSVQTWGGPYAPADGTGIVERIGATFDGGGSAIALNKIAYVHVPYAVTAINQWTVVCDQDSGANGIIITPYMDAYAEDTLPTTTMCASGSAPHTSGGATAGGTAHQAAWDCNVTAIPADRVVAFKVTQAPSSATWCTVSLKVTR
ncbi:MAG: hypothetical protein LLG97_19405, partial [Deltaproteobacteria bacterium]|nr:hypothetical protein [Deltaproteobacteria bacterium]